MENEWISVDSHPKQSGMFLCKKGDYEFGALYAKTARGKYIWASLTDTQPEFYKPLH